MSQNGQKPTLLMTSLIKKPENPKNFFSLQTRKLADSFESLNSSLAQYIDRGAMLLARQLNSAAFRLISKYQYIVPWQQTC